ncbi:unnamed protein product [Bursaphelenchus okinawaensis]|uniref:HAP1 N-terminal domain-containing protein n=1 Tax=Bursaphelenchus okinawaensis TaxID=465554 RepID=A0A811JVL5_9BILA|nr:unnamed protein product [Bursaphelenchus okinawaensis]CAG9085804.1 unnamed protein product [Bursaphelenchus okinawaensis]
MAARNQAAASAYGLAAHPTYDDSASTSAANSPAESVDNEQLRKALADKDQELEYVAILGNSLLEQNRELQERNEFLEESLTASNDCIQQLKHQLQQRSDLLEAYSEYDEQRRNSPTDKYNPAFVERLQARVKKLEDENEVLKCETSRLNTAAVELEDRTEDRVKDYLDQLERANYKISRLQKQLKDKTNECAEQDQKIQHFLKEISSRKKNEKRLDEENMDLREELTDAIRTHEELKLEVEQLSERYVEVAGLLTETKDELSILKSKQIGSWGSLYDSLASELEASDSGFYNTPMISARSDSQTSTNDSYGPISLQQEFDRLEPIAEQPCCSTATVAENLSFEKKTTGESSDEGFSYYDMPSKAVLYAVRRSISTERRRRKSPSHTPFSTPNESIDDGEDKRRPNTLQLCSHPSIGYLEPVAEQTPLNDDGNLEIQKAKGLLVGQNGGLVAKTIDSEAKVDEILQNQVLFDEEKTVEDVKGIEIPVPSLKLAESSSPSKTYRNQSCSPIHFDKIDPPKDPNPPDEPTPRPQTCLPYSGATSYMPNSETSNQASDSSIMSDDEDANDEVKMLTGVDTKAIKREMMRQAALNEAGISEDGDGRILEGDDAKRDSEGNVLGLEPEGLVLQSGVFGQEEGVSGPESGVLRSTDIGRSSSTIWKSESTLRRPSYVSLATKTKDTTDANSKEEDDDDLTPRTLELLNNYKGPRLGEPGRPGTKDLEFSLKRMEVRRKIEDEYERFRQRRGLGPSKALFCTIRHVEKSKLYGPTTQPGTVADPTGRVELVGQPTSPLTHPQNPRQRGLDPAGVLVGNPALGYGNWISIGAANAKLTQNSIRNSNFIPNSIPTTTSAHNFSQYDYLGEAMNNIQSRAQNPRPITKSYSFGLLSRMPGPQMSRLGLDGAVLANEKDGIANKAAEHGVELRRRTFSPDAKLCDQSLHGLVDRPVDHNANPDGFEPIASQNSRPITLETLNSMGLTNKKQRPTSWIGPESWIPTANPANWLASFFTGSESPKQQAHHNGNGQKQHQKPSEVNISNRKPSEIQPPPANPIPPTGRKSKDFTSTGLLLSTSQKLVQSEVRNQEKMAKIPTSKPNFAGFAMPTINNSILDRSALLRNRPG